MGLKRHNNPRGMPGTNAKRQDHTTVIKQAQAEMDEAAAVASNSPADAVRAEALTAAIDQYRKLCALHSVCTIRNCLRKRWQGWQRCKSHSVNYARPIDQRKQEL